MQIDDNSPARALTDLARRRDSAWTQALQVSISLAGASSDWPAVDAIAKDIAALGLTDPASVGPIAFWLAVQERYAEAAAVYARIGPLPEYALGWWGAALLGGAQGLPALLRTYRTTGRADEAVAALRIAFELAHLVWYFDPQLPWFRSLEGHPGYAELLAERQRRIDEARAEMRAIEAQYPDSVIVKTIRAAGI